MSNKSQTLIRKRAEFDLFTHILESGEAAGHLYEIAEALGVARETLSEWQKDPRVIEAKTRGIRLALQEMQKAGGSDWKMWKDKLSLYGLSAVQKSDFTSGGEKLEALVIIKAENETA